MIDFNCKFGSPQESYSEPVDIHRFENTKIKMTRIRSWTNSFSTVQTKKNGSR